MTIGTALWALAKLEKEMQEDGYVPVPGLKGNYHEVANLHLAYFDDQGNYVSVAKDAPLAKDATFSRKSIQALYSKAAEKPADHFIGTWDDFYREIVYSHPLENLVLSDQDKQDPKFPHIMQEIADTLKVMHDIEHETMSKKERQVMEKEVLSFSGSAFYRAFDAVQWDKSGTKDSEGGKHKIVHDYEAALLTTLMRMGGKLYQQFTTSLSASPDTIHMLAEVGEAIETFARRCFYFSPEQAKQLAGVIMQGPDPYAGKPLPLEIFYKQHRDYFVAEPKKNRPKPPSAG
jgi:hypothetical protein